MKRTLWMVEDRYTSEVKIFINKDKAWEYHDDYGSVMFTPAQIEVIEVTE